MVITVISFVVWQDKVIHKFNHSSWQKYLINNTVNVSASLIAQLVKNLPAMQDTPVQFLGWKICWRRGRLPTPVFLGFPCGSAGKESTCNKGDLGSIPRLGRSPGEGNGNPLQYSCLENPMDRGAWQATVHGVTRVWYDLETKPPQPYSSWVTKSHKESEWLKQQRLSDTQSEWLSNFHFTINITLGKVSVIVLILILEFVVTLPFFKTHIPSFLF